MQILFQIVLVVHVLFAMLGFSATAFLPRQVREALAADRNEARRQLPSLVRQSRAFTGTGIVMLLTGLLLASLWPRGMVDSFHGPFAGLPVRFHIGLTLLLIWWGIGASVVRPTLARIDAIVAGDAAIESAHPLAKRVGMLTGISHLLFTAILVVMLWRL